MADNNIWDPNPPAPEEIKPDTPKPKRYMRIVGYNLIVLAAYTVALLPGWGGAAPFFDAFILAIHFVLCVIVSISIRKWEWALSGILVLIIGFSTCVGILWRTA